MSDSSFRIAELLLDGQACGHILTRLALEAQGEENPNLVKAVGGLSVGMSAGKTCGALTAGCCVLSLYAGRGDDPASEHPEFDLILGAYTRWFEENAAQYGGINCADIAGPDLAEKPRRCPTLVLDAWEKINQILEDHNIRVDAPPQENWEEDAS